MKTTFDTMLDTELRRVSGGWDALRTGHAAADGAAYPFRFGKAVGEKYLGEPGKYVGGAIGGALTPLVAIASTPLNMFADAAEQVIGIPETRMDNATLRRVLRVK
jgi:hypothetical protein